MSSSIRNFFKHVFTDCSECSGEPGLYCCFLRTALCGALSRPVAEVFTCLALHKKGLFAGGVGGTLCELELAGNHALVVWTYDVGVPITSLSFNASHQTLAIGSTQVGLQWSESGCSRRATNFVVQRRSVNAVQQVGCIETS